MTRDDVIRMAREAGIDYAFGSELERFAALVGAMVAVAEREACAEVCEMQMNAVVARHPARIEFDPDNIMAQKCAAAIRSRGDE